MQSAQRRSFASRSSQTRLAQKFGEVGKREPDRQNEGPDVRNWSGARDLNPVSELAFHSPKPSRLRSGRVS